MEVLPGGSLCTGPSSDFNNGKDLPSGFSLDAAVVGYRKCKSGYNVATCKAHCMQIAACGTISINAAGCCFVYESTSCPESSHASKSQYSAYKKIGQLKVQVQKPATGACPSGYALTEAECAGLDGQIIDGKSVKYIHGATYGNPEQCGCYFDSGNKVYFNRRTTDCTKTDAGEIGICKDTSALDPCKTNNGGCDSKRKCTNAGKGVATCGDCSAPQINDGAKGCKDYDIKDFAGDYDQAYSNGHKDSTSVECNGNVKWRGSKLNGKLFLAGSKLPADRAAQNNDPNYKAADGWFFRPWDRPLAWEFVKFSNGQMFVHHFCKDQAYCNGKLQSPKGSGNFCCDSTSQRKPISCVDPCKTNNGGCDSKRKCTNAGKGVATCGDCPAPQINDGAKGCKVAAPHMEVLPGGSLCTGPSSDFNHGKDLPSGFSLDAAVVGYRKCKSGYNVATCKAHCMQIAACGTISINAAGCCFVYESTSCPESSHASKSQYSAYKKLAS